MRNYKSQLRSLNTGEAIQTAGGVVGVFVAGHTKKVDLFSPSTGLPIANPQPLVYGAFDFNVPDNVPAVDLYIQSPTGHFVVLKNLKASGDASVQVDTNQTQGAIVIPFNFADQAGNAAETRTGFKAIGAVLPTPAVQVTGIDDTETIDVGTLSSDSGDADGFIDGISLAAAGYVKASLANGAVTLGADLKVQDSANAGDAAPEQNASRIGKEITYTLSDGTDTGAGFIILPYQLSAASFV